MDRLRQFERIRREDGLWRVLADLGGFLHTRAAARFLHAGWPGAVIKPGSQIRGRRHIHVGSGFRAGRNLWIEAITRYEGVEYRPEIRIGSRVAASDSVHISAAYRIVIGDNVLMGSFVHITDHHHGGYTGAAAQSSPDMPPAARPLVSKGETVIEDNVWLGNGVVVSPGVRIGRGAVIGANAVVTRDIPAETIAVGTPARPIRCFDRQTRVWKAWGVS